MVRAGLAFALMISLGFWMYNYEERPLWGFDCWGAGRPMQTGLGEKFPYGSCDAQIPNPGMPRAIFLHPEGLIGLYALGPKHCARICQESGSTPVSREGKFMPSASWSDG